MSAREFKANRPVAESQRCPKCSGGFALGEDVVRCDGCARVYHRSCWLELEGHCPQCPGFAVGVPLPPPPYVAQPEAPPPADDVLPSPESVIAGPEPAVRHLEYHDEAIAPERPVAHVPLPESDVRRCAGCGAESPAGSSYCSGCGSPLPPAGDEAGTAPCPVCKKPIKVGAVKCRHCGWVLDPAIRQAQAAASVTGDAPGAGEALTYAIISIFICGLILGPIAIGKANKVLGLIRDNPGYGGKGKATAALVIGIVAAVLNVLGLLMRFAGTCSS